MIEEQIASLNFSRFRMILRLREAVELPPFKGFALRGVFGTALRELSCTTGHKDCAPCPRNMRCPYRYLFETASADTQGAERKFNSFPRPYVLVPPHETRQSYKKDDSIIFELLLFGRATDYLPHVITAFEQAGRNGFKRKGMSGRFTLELVESMDAAGREQENYRNGYISIRSHLPWA